MISARPRVINAAIEFWAKPSPYDIPAAMAITFFSAPPSSADTMSSEEYTRNNDVLNRSRTSRAGSIELPAATTAAG